MRYLFGLTLFLGLSCSVWTGCKVSVADKKSQAKPAPIPTALSSWDGRSDRTDSAWTLQSLR